MGAPAFRFVDLFAGVGGFHHALSAPEFNGECVFACDIDPDCRAVYHTTWPTKPATVNTDIREFTRNPDGTDRSLTELDTLIPDHDVLCGGFPCQPFSKSGAQQGIQDTTRGTLFFDILRIIEAKQPRFVILENVRNLAGPRHTHTWETIIASLRALNYRVSDTPVILSPHLLSPAYGGRPQTRDRVFILATREQPGAPLHENPLLTREPSPGWNPNQWDIHKYLQPDSTIKNIQTYKLKDTEVAWLNAWNEFVQTIPDETLPAFPIWVDAFTMKPKIPSGTPEWKK